MKSWYGELVITHRINEGKYTWKATSDNWHSVLEHILNDEPLLMSISSDDFSIIKSAVDKVAMALQERLPQYKLPQHVWMNSPANDWPRGKTPSLYCIGDLWLVSTGIRDAMGINLAFGKSDSRDDVTGAWNLYKRGLGLKVPPWFWLRETNVCVFHSERGYSVMLDKDTEAYLIQEGQSEEVSVGEIIKAITSPDQERNYETILLYPKAWLLVSDLSRFGTVAEQYVWDEYSVCRLRSALPECAPHAWVIQPIQLPFDSSFL